MAVRRSVRTNGCTSVSSVANRTGPSTARPIQVGLLRLLAEKERGEPRRFEVRRAAARLLAADRASRPP
eukprot:924904-Heterocapsa_arctica.AAC.1